MAIQERVQKIVSDFQKINDWETRYEKLIQMGKLLPELSEDLKTEEAKVKGCQSQVWLHARLGEDRLIYFSGDSDSVLVKGILALVLEVYSASTPQEILMTSPEFVKDIGLQSHLSPSRANGLLAMIKQIKNFALAFSLMTSQAPK